jgi:hypothetical protein
MTQAFGQRARRALRHWRSNLGDASHAFPPENRPTAAKCA